jgi:hypothetical protein
VGLWIGLSCPSVGSLPLLLSAAIETFVTFALNTVS